MRYQYGEIFERLGIPGMGHQGATWCAEDPQGVLVLMAHQNYFRKISKGWIYEMPREGPMPARGPSATKSLAMIGNYFAPDKEIVLAVATFVTDGGPRRDGTWEASKFKHATGDAYRAKMKCFDRIDGYLLCDIVKKFSV